MKRILLGMLLLATVWVGAGCSAPPGAGPLEARNRELDALVGELEAKGAALEARNKELEARSKELEARSKELEARSKELEARNRELADRLSEQGRPVNLISPHYPPAVGGSPGWAYHQALSADFDGDGQRETVSVTTNAEWVPARKEFGWDDGHPWHVYVEESDGRRTYLFSNWVQMGRLEVILDREGPGLFIVSSRGGGLIVYRAVYRGPGQVTTVEAFSIPLSESATWVDPLRFTR